MVVDAEAALHRDRNVHLLNHGLADLSHKFWLKHQLCAKRAVDRALRRATAVQIYLVVPVSLHNLGRLCDFNGIVSSDLADDRVLVRRELKQPLVVEDSVLVQHLCIQEGVLSQQAHEPAKVVVGHVDHRRDGDALLHGVDERALEWSG